MIFRPVLLFYVVEYLLTFLCHESRIYFAIYAIPLPPLYLACGNKASDAGFEVNRKQSTSLYAFPRYFYL